MLKKITDYKGKIIFNKSYPDGVKRRQLDSSIMNRLGWKPKIKLENGLRNYCQYYIKKIYLTKKINFYFLRKLL